MPGCRDRRPARSQADGILLGRHLLQHRAPPLLAFRHLEPLAPTHVVPSVVSPCTTSPVYSSPSFLLSMGGVGVEDPKGGSPCEALPSGNSQRMRVYPM